MVDKLTPSIKIKCARMVNKLSRNSKFVTIPFSDDLFEITDDVGFVLSPQTVDGNKILFTTTQELERQDTKINEYLYSKMKNYKTE